MEGIQEPNGEVVEAITEAPIESVDTPEIQSVPDVQGEEPAPETLKESARETVARLAREMVSGPEDKKDSGVQGQGEAKKVRDQTGKFVKTAAETPTPQEEEPVDKFDPSLQVPNRLSPEGKAFFNKAPTWVKKEISKTVRDLESGAGKVVGQAQSAIKSVNGIMEAVQPFVADWAKRHVTAPQGIAELCGMYSRLSNPQTAAKEYIELGQKLGVNFDELSQAVKTGQIPGLGKEASPQITTLQERQNQLESKISEWQTQQAVQPIVNEMATVKYEVDPTTGKYRYPELHDGNYLRSLSERVTELVEKFGQTHADALKRANAEKKEALFGIPPQTQIQTRTPPSNQQNINNKAVTAAVTVRGKTSPLLANNGGNQEPPPEALKSPQATTRWVLEQMKNGRA